MKTVALREVLKHRKGSITIDDAVDYKLCRVQLHRKGVVLRQVQKGIEIRTKKQQVCKTGDFIVAEMDAKVGGYGFIPAELDGAIVSSHYYLFEVNEARLLPSYLYVLTQTDYIQSQIKATGSTNYASIRPHEVLELTIPLPSLEQQQRIVTYYHSARKKAEEISSELQTQQTLLTQLRQAVLQEAVQGKLTAKFRATQPAKSETGADLLARIRAEKGDLIRQGKLRKEKPLPPITDAEKPFDLPEGWVWCRLGEVITLISGQHIESSDYNEKGIGLPYLTGPSDFGDTYPVITKWTDKPKVLAEQGDILITVKGSGVGKLNLCNIEKVVISRQLMAIRPNTVEVGLIYVFLKMSYDTLQADKKGTGIPGIDRETILEKLFPLPPLKEQAEILIQTERLMSLLDSLETENQQQQAEVDRLMQAVLREAFAGKTNELQVG